MVYLILFLISFGVSVSAMPLLKRIAFRYGIMIDNPGMRKVHGQALPRNGGLGLVFAYGVSMCIGLVMQPAAYAALLDLMGITLSSLVIVLLGVHDDIRGLNASKKFAVQTGAALIFLVFDGGITHIYIPFWRTVELLPPLGILLTILWMVGVTNAFNLIDGMDGLAGGVAMIAAFVLFILSLISGKVLVAMITISLCGGCLGFLIHNYPPSSIFMGDCGSMFLGFTLAAISIKYAYKSATTASILIPMAILGVPLLDTTFAIARRLRRGHSPFRPDGEHIHHRLLNLGLNPRRAGLILYGVCVFLGAAAFIATTVHSHVASIIVTAAIGLLILASAFIRRLPPR